jgi:hypothetical protein
MGAFYFVGLRSIIEVDSRVGAKGAAMLRPYKRKLLCEGAGRRGYDALYTADLRAIGGGSLRFIRADSKLVFLLIRKGSI